MMKFHMKDPAPFVQTARARDEAPNVLLILCDQMRGDALSSIGSPNARTPNLDRLASQGFFDR